MPDNPEQTNAPDQQADSSPQVQLQSGTYEIIRNRLSQHAKDLQTRLDQLNLARQAVFGAVQTKLNASERITTDNNCVPRDMIPVGDKFIFGYNVFIGLRPQTTLADVFAVYQWQDNSFVPGDLEIIEDERFRNDFANLYKYYRNTRFAKFSIIGPHLFMAFRVGKDVADVKTFKWLIRGNTLEYLDNRSDHQFVFPDQHEFEWSRVTQDMHRSGQNPHISIDDRIFVETVGGDLTVKIEDNTETGEGIYSEPVENPDQTLSDAEIYYAIVGNIILLKVRPYQENQFRYLVYNEKLQEVVRIDAVKDACVLLPDDHGLIFPKGYYLQTGQRKQFDTDVDDLVFEKRWASPNGEDFLYVFYNRESGVYLLLSYNLIKQEVETPMVCHGFSLFSDGRLICFRADGDPQKHHTIQVWQTPYYHADFPIEVRRDSELYKIGNKEIVRCLAECTELITLVGKEETYADLYVDIAKNAQSICDAYFWLNTDDAHHLDKPLTEIAQAASSAIDEFEKVVRTRQNTAAEIKRVTQDVRRIITNIRYDDLDTITAYVDNLSSLRSVRGAAVSLRDLRYADTDIIDALEKEVADHTGTLSDQCVQFLLQPESLQPYRQRVAQQSRAVPDLTKVAAARELSQDVAQTGSELEMLTEIVSNLKIEDATQTVAIIDGISLVYAELNQVKTALKNKLNDLASVEGQAEFSSQTKLIDQSVINFLDICDTPEKCDEYLTKVTVQLESLESRFADFDAFVVQLSEKREEIYNAFESRKVQLVEKRNRRAAALLAAAQRVLKGIGNRVQALTDINEINGYFASDLMIERVREIITQLTELGDAVKAEDVRGQLKTLQQDAVRQLKDKQALYEDGDNIIRLGQHRFSVNRQNLEGTIVQRDGNMFFHLTGTGFFERIDDPDFLATQDVWSMDVLSESNQVYRAEYLAYLMIQKLNQLPPTQARDQHLAWQKMPPDQLRQHVQEFMGPRFAEGYVKGVHDQDAAKILHALLEMESTIGLLRYSTQARALALTYWSLAADDTEKPLLAAKLASLGQLRRLFAGAPAYKSYLHETQTLLARFVDETQLFDPNLVDVAAQYLCDQLGQSDKFTVSRPAVQIAQAFKQHLKTKGDAQTLTHSAKSFIGHPLTAYRLQRDWIIGFLTEQGQANQRHYADEAALLLALDDEQRYTCLDISVERDLTEMAGAHPLLHQGRYNLDYCDFMARLTHHQSQIAPKFNTYLQTKNDLLRRYADQLRLDEFKPRVLTTFVRNQLIDRVYLPLIGDNLAKQIGAEGDNKRTDRQGLLLLISPPGYGKTTLMEYTANRLGLIFMKINGPAIGHRVTSFDPAEAPNAAAREELAKLNLAFEMGDNVMIYVDDIQHTNPEFLQKFISLCDAQRRVEGVYHDRSKTYDLRGKRVCVVMAGNPYTESGEKFRIPDMLANRADIYNIGDIVGDNYDSFVLSYIENALTSNPVLAKLANRSQQDVYAFVKLTETGRKDDIEFEGNYAIDEINEYVATLTKLFVVRDIVLKVNQQYIRSAGQSDDYRIEPPFLLQGSYRNMNRIAARVLPVMNDDELWTLIHSSYEQDAQTLTTGAESNLLKFRELVGRISEPDAKRWQEIKSTFGRNQLLGSDTDDKITQVVRQLNAFGAGLDAIRDVIAQGATALTQPAQSAQTQAADKTAAQLQDLGQNVLTRLNDVINAIKHQQHTQQDHDQDQQAAETRQTAQTLVAVLEEQFATMQTWLMRVTRNKEGQRRYVNNLIERFEAMTTGYQQLIEYLRTTYHPDDDQEDNSPPNEEPNTKPSSKKPRPNRKSRHGN